MKIKENYKDMEKEEIIKSEKEKLSGIYERLDINTKKSVSALIDQASFMAASLYELSELINEEGYTEEYQNGANQSGRKKSSNVEIYNSLIKNYSSVIKQLTDLLPKVVVEKQEINDGLDDFITGRKDV